MLSAAWGRTSSTPILCLAICRFVSSLQHINTKWHYHHIANSAILARSQLPYHCHASNIYSCVLSMRFSWHSYKIDYIDHSNSLQLRTLFPISQCLLMLTMHLIQSCQHGLVNKHTDKLLLPMYTSHLHTVEMLPNLLRSMFAHYFIVHTNIII
jgi:hypothetical protein